MFGLDVALKVISVLDTVENIVVKEENSDN